MTGCQHMIECQFFNFQNSALVFLPLLMQQSTTISLVNKDEFRSFKCTEFNCGLYFVIALVELIWLAYLFRQFYLYLVKDMCEVWEMLHLLLRESGRCFNFI